MIDISMEKCRNEEMPANDKEFNRKRVIVGDLKIKKR
jgi:hypothetical protein